jgi:release factor glutamine methyltransferase
MTGSIKSLYEATVLKLSALYIPTEARAIADRLFEHYFQMRTAQRVMAGRSIPDTSSENGLNDAVNQLLNNVPLQYVLGKTYFMDMEFEVNPSVLIPRPETEELVSLIMKEIAVAKPVNNLQILDIGTGSGSIAISLKHLIPRASVTAIDISKDALQVAKGNASNNNLIINFLNVNILDKQQWNVLPHCDIIVSNPPYVTHIEKQYMNKNVLDHEPHIALFVPDDDPLIFYRFITDFALLKLNAGGSLWFEINEKFGEDLKMMTISKGLRHSKIFSDIHGKSRFLHAIK